MGNEETVAIDRTGVVVGVAGVERIGLAVEPFPLRLVRIDLTFQRHIVGHSPFEAGPKPKLPGASEVVEHIVVGFEGAGVDGHRTKVVRVERRGRRAARDDALCSIWAGEGDGDQGRAPVRIACVPPVFDRNEGLENIGHAIVESRRDVREVLVHVVDEAVDPALADADVIVEALEGRTAARREPGADRTERIG